MARKRKKNPIAAALARLRAKKLTPAQRTAQARKAAQARWAKRKKKAEP